MRHLDAGGIRVALVNMPLFTVYHPSIALGLLKAQVALRGGVCDAHHLNVEFAEFIGLASHDRFCHCVSSTYNAMLGEWLFAGELFGDHCPNPERYVEAILKPRFRRSPEHIVEALRVRGEAGRFLDECLAHIDWSRYDVVGFSSIFQQTTASLALARRLKAAHPQLKVVLGGANCEGRMGLTLFRSFSFLDAVFCGEADATFPAYLSALRAGGPDVPMDGVFARAGGRELVSTTSSVPVEDLDGLPFPDYDDYFAQIRQSPLRQSIEGPASPQVVIETSRGCWWGAKNHCTFCGLNGSTMAFRSKSPARALAEIVHLHERYGCFLQTVDNILDLRYLTDLFPELARRKLGVQLFYETKVNLTPAQLDALRDAGVVAVQAGVESLSTEILRLMRKGATALQNIQFLKWCRERGIDVAWNLIWGFPAEDPNEYSRMAALVERIRHLPPPLGINKLQLHRFSPYFNQREALGVRDVRPHPAYRHIFPFPEGTVADLAYYFVFEYVDGRDPQEYAAPLARKLKKWRNEPTTYRLEYRDDGESLVVRRADRGVETTWRLRGWQRELYLFCDSARLLAAVLARVPEAAAGGREWIEGMVDDGLMLALDGSYLSLALRVGAPAARAGLRRESRPQLVALQF